MSEGHSSHRGSPSSSNESSSNKIRQLFYKPVDNVAGRDVVINHHHEAERPLTKSERGRLTALVKPLATEHQVHESEEWRALHFPFGVNSMDEMNKSHFEPAHQLLTAKLECAQLQRELAELRENLEHHTAAACRTANKRAVALEQDCMKLSQQYNQLADKHIALERMLVARTQKVDELTTSLQNIQRDNLARTSRKRWLNRSIALVAVGGPLIAMGMVYQPTFQAELRAEDNRATMLKRVDICLFDGKPFSWGTRLPTSTGVQKCVQSRTGQYLWQPDNK